MAAEDTGGRLLPAGAVPAGRVRDRIPSAYGGIGLRWSPGPFRRLDAVLGHHWSWIGAIGQAVVLVVWILFEFVVLPDQMLLQPILIGVGLLMIALSLSPSLRRFYAIGATAEMTRRGEFSDLDIGA